MPHCDFRMRWQIASGLQKRRPIFGFIGAETGPKFEVEMDNENNKKTISTPVLGCNFMYHEVRFCILRAHRSWVQQRGLHIVQHTGPSIEPMPGPILERTISGPQSPF